jgi:hypothetical protein
MLKKPISPCGTSAFFLVLRKSLRHVDVACIPATKPDKKKMI